MVLLGFVWVISEQSDETRRWQINGETAAAEIDHSDDGLGGVVSVAAVVDESNLGVESLELRVRETELDRRQDPLAILAHRLGQLHERGDARTTRPAQPPLEVRGRIGRVLQPIEVAQSLFELPAPIKDRVVLPEIVQDLELLVAQVVRIFEQCPAGVLHSAWFVARSWGFVAPRSTPR